MNIDMAALRSLEREKDVTFEQLVEAIEAALLVAYQRTEGAKTHARVVLDRATGDVTVFATEMDDDGQPDSRIRRHPARLQPGGGHARPSRSSCSGCATPSTS